MPSAVAVYKHVPNGERQRQVVGGQPHRQPAHRRQARWHQDGAQQLHQALPALGFACRKQDRANEKLCVRADYEKGKLLRVRARGRAHGALADE